MSYLVHFNGDVHYATKKRLKISGDIFEYYDYGREYFVGSRPKSFKDKPKKSATSQEILDQMRHRRARRQIIDYTNSNTRAYFDQRGRAYWPVFITLTFRENITDLKFANYEFTKFIQRLNTAVNRQRESFFKYVTVVEFQDRGAIHYHCIFFNLPYKAEMKRIFEKCWTLGFTKIKAINRVRNVGRYITKYMSKNIDDERLRGQKSYFISKGLFKPIVVNYDELINPVLSMMPPESMEYSKDNIKVDFFEFMNYKNYNLRKYQKRKKEALAFLNRYGYYGEERTK
ncbi:MAG: hypothetical protein M0Q92_13880 [Methanoregula sp.]|jgi:hypothetical protein|nr:hypothetical protein [Methanoregula sp.]